MATFADLQARVRRLEQRQRLRRGAAAVCPVPADAANLRTVLKMLIEAGGEIDLSDVDATVAEVTTSAPTMDFKAPRVRTALRMLLRSQPDYEQEDDSNTALDAGTSDPTGPIFDALARMGA